MLGTCDMRASSSVADDLHIWRHHAPAATELRAAGPPTARAGAGPRTFFWIILAIVLVVVSDL